MSTGRVVLVTEGGAEESQRKPSNKRGQTSQAKVESGKKVVILLAAGVRRGPIN